MNAGPASDSHSPLSKGSATGSPIAFTISDDDLAVDTFRDFVTSMVTRLRHTVATQKHQPEAGLGTEAASALDSSSYLHQPRRGGKYYHN